MTGTAGAGTYTGHAGPHGTMGAMSEPLGTPHDVRAEDPAAPRRGLAAVTDDEFSVLAAVGGVRGLVESVLPGLVFIVLYVTTQDLMVSVIASVGAAVAASVVRLVQGTAVTTALGGLLGVVVGAVWAWRTGEAEDVYAWALWTNAAYAVVLLASIVFRFPAVGFVVESLRAGWSPDAVKAMAGRDEATEQEGARPASGTDETADGAREAEEDEPNPLAALVEWRHDAEKVHRYTLATWLWVGMFALRLAVKVPLYLDGDVGWLGTFHLVLGVPLWALVLFLTWVVVRGRTKAPAA